MADFPSARAFTMLPSTERQKLAGRYTIALSVAAFAVLLRWCLEPLLGHVAFYVTVYMAVAFCALICGLGPAVLSGLTGFLGIFYWFVDPRRSLALGRAQIHSIIGFFLVCAVLIWLGESNRRRQLRLNAAVVALTAEIAMRWRHAPSSSQEPLVVAVARFDNETGDPAINHFSDGLTDNLVVALTQMSQNKFRVIGNASVLRGPRDQRDLNAIALALHARFIVLGQVQQSGSKTRILAHLIRMPEQTHVWVVRLDKPLDDPLALESSAAQQIASEFSLRVANPAAEPNLHSSSTNR